MSRCDSGVVAGDVAVLVAVQGPEMRRLCQIDEAQPGVTGIETGLPFQASLTSLNVRPLLRTVALLSCIIMH